MLKKTTLAVIGLAASSFASAGTMGPVCTPGNVTVPCEASRWDLGLQALYLKPIYSGARGYRATNITVPPATLILGNPREIKNDWDWGYKAEGSYHFNTGNDVTVNWTHYSSDIDDTGFFGNFTPLLAVGLPALNVPYSLNDRNRFDQVNMVLGQHADFGLVKKMRFYAGLQYAHIQTNSTNSYALSIPAVPGVGAVTAASLVENGDFKGVGPVLGIDYSYSITNELSIIANGAGSILYGTTRRNDNFIVSPTNLVVASVGGSRKTIVPGIEAKLGVNYGYSMAQGVLNLEAGYQVTNYFHAIDSAPLQVLLVSNPNTSVNYGLYGPYLGLKYVGNA